jgi:hypothetical protein
MILTFKVFLDKIKSGEKCQTIRLVVFRPGEHGPAKCSIWRWKEE